MENKKSIRDQKYTGQERHHTFIYREHSAQDNGQKGINKPSTKSNLYTSGLLLIYRLFSTVQWHCIVQVCLLFVQFCFVLTKGGINVFICRQVNFWREEKDRPTSV